MGKPVTHVKLESIEGRMPLFSEWSQQYISDKMAKDSADVHGKRQKACAAFLEVCGNKRLSEYDKVHAIELARYLDNDKNGKQWAKATIKNYNTASFSGLRNALVPAPRRIGPRRNFQETWPQNNAAHTLQLACGAGRWCWSIPIKLG